MKRTKLILIRGLAAFVVKTRIAVSWSLLFVCSATVRADVISFGSGANQFNMDFVTIGNPGNEADTTASPNPAGSVGYVYNIGKYEVSRDMVTKANAEGGLGITLDGMGVVTGGPRPAMPATGVTWNEAARFVNWLNTSQGFSPAYKFTMQPGDAGYDANANIELWQPGDAGYDANNLFRNSLARYFLPSVHEWYKAAYYDPSANGGAGGYWDYPTVSDSLPTPIASGTDPGSAVWGQGSFQGPADITQAGGLSPYGTMAQGGNVWEWAETEFDLVNDAVSSVREKRGGSYHKNLGPPLGLAASPGYFNVPTNEDDALGFRVASIPSIPEPSTGLLAALGMFALVRQRRWF